MPVRWHKLNEDVSFESFTYDEAEPSAFQRFFLEHPEINIAEFSKAIGLNPSLDVRLSLLMLGGSAYDAKEASL